MRKLFQKKTPTVAPSPPEYRPLLKNTRLSPLEIPELLERIFSFLDDRILASTVQRVCTQWYIQSKHLVPINVELDLGPSNKARMDILAKIPQATRVVLTATHDRYWQKMQQVHDRLSILFSEKDPDNITDALLNKCTLQGIGTRPAPLKELVLGGDFLEHVAFFLPDVLQRCSTLTMLTLCSSSHCDPVLSLGNLLTAYPNLTALELLTSPSASSTSIPSSAAGGAFVVYEAGLFLAPEDHTPTSEIPSRLHLESIHFRNVSVSQAIVQSMVKASPRLRDLRLWNLCPKVLEMQMDGYQAHLTPFDVPEFLEFLMTSRLKLERFAFSMAGDQAASSLAEMDIDRILGRFEMWRSHAEARIQEWGFSPGMCTALAHVPNRITTLELVSERGCNSIKYSKGLHEFLCHAPHLLHLKARTVAFRVTHLDVNHFPSIPHWACKGLLTLQLRLSAASNVQAKDLKPADFRLVCGYFVRFCLQLRDVELAGTGRLEFGLDSGFAILSRLQSLQRIILEVFSRSNLEKTMNRIWTAVQPTKADLFRRQVTLTLWQQRLAVEAVSFEKIVASTEPDSSFFDLDSSALPWMDLKYIGSFWDVKMALEALEADLGLKRCWPKLSCLGLEFREDVYLNRTITAGAVPLLYKDRKVCYLMPLPQRL